MSLLGKLKTIPPEASTAGGEKPPKDDIAAKLAEQFSAVERNELESVPRETVLKMLIQKKLDEHFIFKTIKGDGNNYIQAMRQVLSRTRKTAYKKKQRLDEFKMFVISVVEKTDHDEVTLMRSKSMQPHLESVYDALMDAFKK